MVPPTPQFEIEWLDATWIQSEATAETHVIGKITNMEDFPLENVQIMIHLNNRDDAEGSTFSTTTIPGIIQPATEALYQFSLPEGFHQAEYSMSFTAERSTTGLPVLVDVNMIEWRQLPDGSSEALGEVVNLGDHLLNLKAIAMYLYDENEQPLGVAWSDRLVSTLPPQAAVPFSASFNRSIKLDSWEAFVDASPELLPPQPPLRLTDSSRMEKTHQGGFYYIAEVLNEGVTPWWPVMDITYRYQDGIIGLDTLAIPLPLGPDSSLFFSVDPQQVIPGELLSRTEADAITLEIAIDPWRSLPTLTTWIPLVVEITQFEPIGGRLYIRGVITNPHDSMVANPVTKLAILDVFGRTRAVGWRTLSDMLEPGTSIRFEMDLLIPENVDLNQVEFDLLAHGAIDTGN